MTADDFFLKSDVLQEPRRLIGEYQFRLGTLRTMITIRLYEYYGRGGVWFEQSHYIKTPALLDAYRTSISHDADEASALRTVVSNTLVRPYEEALRMGHKPDESWLVAEDAFFAGN